MARVNRIVSVLFLLLVTACIPGRTSPSTGTGAAPAAGAYIQNKGSDTLVNVALAWAEKYQQLHSDIRISVTGGGSGTGIAALINGTVDLANASRKITPGEMDEAQKNGIHPVEIVVARDAIGVIVNPYNPVQTLTLQQISDIYTGRIQNWNAVGGEDRPIVRLSRETNSGTHVYFLETVIRLGNKQNKDIFSADTLLLPSSEGIISEVRDNPNAIGYDGLGYITPEVKVVPVAPATGQPGVAPSIESVNARQYPIARDLYMYTAKEPTGAIKTYLDWILSPEAQAIVKELGFVPIK
ncbi:MAG: phosphate ABC transporter substrate-binding protein [Anaerolineaceae bacterium]|nr:phosphate ABC transporter substrate-binding protein [Anaerolineaceae bacterium]